MPVNLDYDQEEEDKKGTGAETGPQMVTSGQGSQIGTATPGQQKTQEGSGTFTNIQDYIKANKPKTRQLAEGITSDIREKSQKLGTDLGQTREKFLGEKGTFGKGQQDFTKKMLETSGLGDSGKIKQENIQRFRDIREGKADAADLTKQRQTAADLERRAKGFQSAKGRQEELQRAVGGRSGQYATGQRTLDRLLLAGDKESVQRANRAVREATKGASERVDTLGTDIGSAKEALQTEAEKVGESLRSREDILRDRYQGLQSGLQTGSLTPEQYKMLGLTKGERTYGFDPLSALERTRGLSQSDVAQLEALSQMAGQEGRSIFQDIEGGDLAADMRADLTNRRQAYMEDAHAQYLQGVFDRQEAQGPLDERNMRARDNWRRTRYSPYMSQYGGTAKDGGVMESPKSKALKKIRGY